MNNSDFQRLLLTDDKSLVSELTKPRAANKAKKNSKFFSKGEGKGGKGKGEGKGEGKGGAKGGAKGGGKSGKGGQEGDGPKQGVAAGPQSEQYRDRAKERREQKGEYENIAEEWENHGEVSVDESKYLGGDLGHTHLVKGLDYALLTKVRTEISKQTKAEEIQQVRLKKKGQQQRREFATELGRKVWSTVVDNLHPHHSTFSQRIEKMSQALALGQRMRGAPSIFLPGRMCYEFDTGVVQAKTDIPRIVYISKEDAPSVDVSKRVAPILPDTVSKVREAFQRATEERKQRKRERAQGAEPSHVVAQKTVATRHKAKDAEDDIFQGAGGFDTTELAKKAKSSSEAPERASSSKGGARPSYFADAGSEKYRQAPEGQIELKDLEVEEHDRGFAGGEEASAAAAAFEASDKFGGAKAGWVFKLGSLGLGYYMDSKPGAQKTKAKAAATAGTGTSDRGEARHAAARPQRTGAPVPDEEDAYDECFPSAGLGHALVQTGEDASDEEAAEAQKKRIAKLGKKKDDGKGDTLTAHQKNADPKKRKMNEAQEWQKIDSMIKKGKHGSVAELEAYASKQKRNQPPVPREIMSTPAFF